MSHKRTSGANDGGRAQRAQEIGLFRYALIRPVADPALTGRERGPLVRELSEQEHLGPFGDRVRVSRVTLDRWIRTWRVGGFDALVPSARHVEPHTSASVLELAVALKREVPGRTAAQVAAILAEHAGSAPSARQCTLTLRRPVSSGVPTTTCTRAAASLPVSTSGRCMVSSSIVPQPVSSAARNTHSTNVVSGTVTRPSTS